jgi:hypothetical protein
MEGQAMIDYTITVGNIIEIGVLTVGGIITVGGGLLALGSFRNTVENLTRDMTDMKAEIKKVGEVLTKMAVTDNRLSNVEQDIRELRHGVGFVQSRSNDGINGEYP